MIKNINYKGRIDGNIIRDMEFSTWKPRQHVDRSGPYTIILFKSGQCRIMGCKIPLDVTLLKYPITNIKVQSVTITMKLGKTVNLFKLAGNIITTYILI